MKRVMYLDIAKGLAIIAVIVGHYFQLFMPEYMNTIYCFHMPLFFLISGMFIKKDVTFYKQLSRKAKQLLLPYAIISGIWTIGLTAKKLLRDGVIESAKQFLKCCYAIIFGGGQGKGAKIGARTPSARCLSTALSDF